MMLDVRLGQYNFYYIEAVFGIGFNCRLLSISLRLIIL